MATYTAIADTEIDKDSPVTAPLMTKMRDNPIAIMEGKGPAPSAGDVVVFRMGYGRGSDEDNYMWTFSSASASYSGYSSQDEQTSFTIYRAGTYRIKFGGSGDGGTSSGNNASLTLYRKPIGLSSVSIGVINWEATSDTGFVAYDNSGADYIDVALSAGDQLYFHALCRNEGTAGPVYISLAADSFFGPIGA